MSSQRQDQYFAGLDGESNIPSKYGAVDVGKQSRSPRIYGFKVADK
jgi:hypothetical protein